MKTFWMYCLVMAGVTYLIRMIPLALVRKKINNRFIRSFLFYVPYAVLGAMTFPAVFYATDHVVSGVIGAVIAVLLAYREKSLLTVALCACGAVFATEGALLLCAMLP